MRPILAENNGWALFISTPIGQNHFADLYEMAKASPDWFAELLTAEATGAITAEAIEAERAAGMPESMIKQEFHCSFLGAIAGAYYAEYFELAEKDGRVTTVPWEPALPVHTSWDLGLDDATAIWFWQRHGKELRIIDYYEASGCGLDHYTKHLAEKPYTYGQHLLPHDVEVKELSTGRSRKQALAALGLKVAVVPKLGVEEGIQAVRSILPQCWFDRDKCARGLKALKAYRTEYDPKTGTNRQRPLHDWTSHAADAFRYLAVGLQRVDKRAESYREPIRVYLRQGGEPSQVLRASDRWARDIRPITDEEACTLRVPKTPVAGTSYHLRPHGEPANDGRQRFEVCNGEGAILALVWGREQALEAALNISNGGQVSAR
jgi:hypothetical protein